jgi:beta-galactosidase
MASFRAALALALVAGAQAGTFVVSDNQFMKDGSPVTLRSGSFHYHRCHPDLWLDRLTRMKAMGLNAVQFYVPWNWHERANNTFDFSGARDVAAFIKLAQGLDMLVLVRSGPYICGEHDFGGLPAYLLTVPGIQLRTNNTQYLSYVDRWYAQLLPVLKPLLYSAGGPVVMVQIENEFGSYGDTGGNPADYVSQRASHPLSLTPARAVAPPQVLQAPVGLTLRLASLANRRT